MNSINNTPPPPNSPAEPPGALGKNVSLSSKSQASDLVKSLKTNAKALNITSAATKKLSSARGLEPSGSRLFPPHSQYYVELKNNSDVSSLSSIPDEGRPDTRNRSNHNGCLSFFYNLFKQRQQP